MIFFIKLTWLHLQGFVAILSFFFLNGRGRGAGAPDKGEAQEERAKAIRQMIAAQKGGEAEDSKKQHLKTGGYWPVFIVLISIAQVALLITEIAYNGGFESFEKNPLVLHTQRYQLSCIY